MSAPEDCRCHECGICYHDHKGWKHKWVTPYPCPGSMSSDNWVTSIWCALQRGHFGQCVFKEDE